MKGTYLGEFEEVVLLAVAIRSGDAYGAAIVTEIEQPMNRSVNLGQLPDSMVLRPAPGRRTGRRSG